MMELVKWKYLVFQNMPPAVKQFVNEIAIDPEDNIYPKRNQ